MGRWMLPYFHLPQSRLRRIHSDKCSVPAPRLLPRYYPLPFPTSCHRSFLLSGSCRTAAVLQSQILCRSTDISAFVPCCQNGFRLRSRDTCIPVILPCTSPIFFVFFLNFTYRTISPSSNGSPHSGQNFGGCSGSSGSQPHLSHL